MFNCRNDHTWRRNDFTSTRDSEHPLHLSSWVIITGFLAFWLLEMFKVGGGGGNGDLIGGVK